MRGIRLLLLEREALAPRRAELEGYLAALEALPATALAMGDGGLRRADLEEKAAGLPADVRGFLESRPVFRAPTDFVSQLGALDRVLEERASVSP